MLMLNKISGIKKKLLNKMVPNNAALLDCNFSTAN